MMKKGTILMWMGAALLLAALALFYYNTLEDNAAGEAADAAVVQLREIIPERPPEKPFSDPYDAPQEESPTLELAGVNYLGILSIPSQRLELPVAADWNYDTLKEVPCRYSGTLEGRDLVICGHNYQRHFGKLENLRAGDLIVFLTAEGERCEFEIVTAEVLQPTDVEQMVASDYPLSLFTCTYSGQTRLVIRCDRV